MFLKHGQSQNFELKATMTIRGQMNDHVNITGLLKKMLLPLNTIL